MMELNETLREILSVKATERFVAYGVTCEPSAAPEATTNQLCGILGFTGDQLCSSVVIGGDLDRRRGRGDAVLRAGYSR